MWKDTYNGCRHTACEPSKSKARVMTGTPQLNLERLHERHPGLTQALGESYTEAACVCWSRHHTPPITVSLKRVNNADQARVVNFTVPDDRTRAAHANEIDATEAGAYGVSLAAIEDIVGLVAVGRAETLTGADWYIAPNGTSLDDLENCIRLEVSGTSAGTSAEINRRLLEKITQASRGDSNLPAIASVVGFKALEVAVSSLVARA
jgi:hypothetical protein